MTAIAAAIAASVTAGLVLRWRLGERAEALARALLAAVLFGLLPFVNFFNLARFDFTVQAGAGIGLAYATLAVIAAAAWLLGRRALRATAPETGAIVLAAILANTGYLGLPLTVAVLGPEHLPAAIVYDVLVGGPVLWVAGFALGAAFGDRAGHGARQRTWAFLRNPPLLAALAGLAAPEWLAPEAAVEASQVAVLAILPLGFFAAGVLLVGGRAGTDQGGAGRGVAVSVVLRVAAAPALLAALAALLIDVPPAYLLMMAMPCGINALAIAAVYGLAVRTTAAAIAWGTGIVVVAGLVATV